MLTIHRHTRHRTGRLFALACLLAAIHSPVTGAEDRAVCRQEKPLVFGILPLLSVEQLVARFSPLVSYLSGQLHVPVHLETAPNFVEFARRTDEDRRYDILYTAPHLYAQANRKSGYHLVASVDSPGMWAIIVVPRLSTIQTLNDLKGKRLATVQPLALATILTRKILSDAGIDPDTDLELVVTPSHDASLLSSYHGITDAAGLMRPPYEAASKAVKRSMRIIARSETTPHIPISAGPWLTDACVKKITAVLVNMADDPAGKSVLQHIRFPGFKNADPRDYEQLNELLSR